MTLALLWEECCAQVDDEYDPEHPVKPWRYSQFCENYRQFAKRLKLSEHFEFATRADRGDFAGPVQHPNTESAAMLRATISSNHSLSGSAAAP
jgi:hypothetical protein